MIAYLANNYFAAPIFNSCIIWNNSSPEIYRNFNSQVSPTITYSDVKGGFSGIGNKKVDPLFVDPALKNYHLQSASPCIEAADPYAQYPEFDKDGNLRSFLGDRYDMGAYEFINGEVPIHIYDDGNMSIQEAIDAAPNDKYFIIVHEGTYYENIDFRGKSIVVKSTNPDDPNVVAHTIIDGGGFTNVVSFYNGEGNGTLLSGFTVRNGYAYYGA